MRRLLLFSALNLFFAFGYAMQHESGETCRLLFRAQTEIFNELYSALEQNNLEHFKELLFQIQSDEKTDETYLFDVNKSDSNGMTLLMHAVSKDRSAFIPIILNRYDLDINKQATGLGSNRNTALHYAVQMNNRHIINQLLQDNRLDVNVENAHQQRAYLCACDEETKKLLKKNAKGSGSCCCNMV